jgi:uncharacterized protein YbjT (DUF2867 family)
MRFAAAMLLVLITFACHAGNPGTSTESHASRIVLVSGATGNQGGATARALLARGYTVRALTRHPESEKSQQLAALGAQLVKGDLNDPASLRAAVDGAYGVFSVGDFWEHGRDGEIRQGNNLADAAQAAGAKHLVYSSVGGADRASGVPHFESKFEVEEHLRTLQVPWTILRPVSFMENWDGEQLRQIMAGTLASPLSPTTHFQQISVSDIGNFAAEAFDHPDVWVGKTVEIAGDDRTMSEVAATFSVAMGKPVRYVQTPWNDFSTEAGEEITAMFRWFEAGGYNADVATLRRQHPFVTSFEAYLKQHLSSQ